MIYGYARVSTDGQSVATQMAALTAAGCDKVFQETASGMKTDRVQLRRALDALGPDDVLMVTRLERLARSTLDLLRSLATITGRGGRVPFDQQRVGGPHYAARSPAGDDPRRSG